jgi:hypothetical protein
MGYKISTYKMLAGKPVETKPLEDLCVHGSIPLKFSLKKFDGRMWNGFTWLKIWVRGWKTS